VIVAQSSFRPAATVGLVGLVITPVGIVGLLKSEFLFPTVLTFFGVLFLCYAFRAAQLAATVRSVNRTREGKDLTAAGRREGWRGLVGTPVVASAEIAGASIHRAGLISSKVLRDVPYAGIQNVGVEGTGTAQTIFIQGRGFDERITAVRADSAADFVAAVEHARSTAPVSA
jgi:hypothetical protein